ncbi:MAG TPA: AI-2E family transporter [Caulobacteraceae bacterium]|jgi:predicted PurR-regulated permease PerM|nr:AI-2E family transporter [Caulobacteraceae bacterium]
MARPESRRIEDEKTDAVTAGVIILVVVALGVSAHVLRTILIPLILSLFLLQVIGGLEGVLTRRLRVPRGAALPLAIAVVVAAFGFAIWLIAQNAVGIVQQSGAYAGRLDQLLEMFAGRFGLQAAPTIDDLFHRLNPGRFAPIVAREAGHILEGAVFVLIYLGFMIAARDGFADKIGRMFPEQRSTEALDVARRISSGVESYVWVQTVVGLIIAGASVAIMAPMGITHLLFWALLIFLANYIPVIGAAIGVVLPPLFGLVELDSLWKPIVLFVALELLHFVVGHVLMPRMQGRRLNIDPIVVLLSLGFWAAIFGVAGAFLSTPLTVAVIIVCGEFTATRWLAVLLSADGKPHVKGPLVAP